MGFCWKKKKKKFSLENKRFYESSNDSYKLRLILKQWVSPGVSLHPSAPPRGCQAMSEDMPGGRDWSGAGAAGTEGVGARDKAQHRHVRLISSTQGWIPTPEAQRDGHLWSPAHTSTAFADALPASPPQALTRGAL